MNLVEQTDRQIRPHHLPAHMALFFEQPKKACREPSGHCRAGKKNERHCDSPGRNLSPADEL
jgi:hypothetical protein